MNRRMMTLVGVLSALVMIFAMCGCGSSEEPAPTEETTQATEATTQVETTTQASDQQEIGEEQAIAIALKDAGFAESDVTYPHVHLDMDDGRPEYDVHFVQGTMEYEYSLDAYTGEILEKDVESVND